MIVVPVVWATANPESIARGYWDQGLLEGILDRSLWRPPSAVAFRHVELPQGATRIDAEGGAVVVVPARHNARSVAWLNELIRPLPWVLLILTGDEECSFPWWRVQHPRMRLWAMGARPGSRGVGSVHQPLGSGFPPWFREAARARWSGSRPTLAFFAGQVTHERREAAVEAMGRLSGAQAVPSPGFTQGLDRETYAAGLTHARIAPCPSGPVSPDSFRLYEALEAGCIPIADAASPLGPDPDYWTFVFGESPPFPQLSSWEALPAICEQLERRGLPERNRVFAWWQGWKRRLALRLDDEVRFLAGEPAREPIGHNRNDDISVVIPTSPTPEHPSTASILAVIESARAQLPLCEVIVVADGVRPELEFRRAAYEEYLERLLWAANYELRNVLVVRREEWGHQANATRAALELVRSPLVLFMEHDTPLCGPEIAWGDCAALIHSGLAHVVRFHHESRVLPDHEALMLPSPEGAGFLRTVQWSQRPHLAPTLWYRQQLERFFGPQSRTMIEDVMHGVVAHHWGRYGEAGWEQFRLWLYARPEEGTGSIQRSGHLDTRGDDPKFPMVFAYDRPRPEGAPAPTRRRP